MRRWHAEIDPQHPMLRGSADCAVTVAGGYSEGHVTMPVPGRRL